MGSSAHLLPDTHKVALDTPKVDLVTPVAQTLEMVKSELARQKVIRGKKRRASFNQLDEPMNYLEENQEDELSVFTPPLTNTGVHIRQWIEYRSTNQISGESPLEFLI